MSLESRRVLNVSVREHQKPCPKVQTTETHNSTLTNAHVHVHVHVHVILWMQVHAEQWWMLHVAARLQHEHEAPVIW